MVNFFLFSFLEILKNSVFARAAVIPYITRNYKNQLRGKLKVE
jgi:hypothetical protein